LSITLVVYTDTKSVFC